MAMQHLVAFSETVDGAAIVAGSLYGCPIEKNQGVCYRGGADVGKANKYLEFRSSKHLIDDRIHLKGMPVLLFNGRNDRIVFPACTKDVQTQLRYFGARVKSVFNTSATHVWSVDHGHCKCGACKSYLSTEKCCDVNNCEYDLSGDILRHIYGDHILPRTEPSLANLRWVNQLPFVPARNKSWSAHGMMKWGLVYANKACKANPATCRVHVNYHGCIADVYQRRRKWSTVIDLNSYAESSNIIVVYPQAAGDAATGKGCWNWG